MSRLLIAASAALLLSGPLLAQGGVAQAATAAPANEREDKAREAFLEMQEAMRAELQEAGNEAAQKVVFTGARAKFLGFGEQWSGTDAELMALSNVGMIDIHILEQPERGLGVLAKVYTKAKARPAELLESSQLTPARAGLMYADALMQTDHFEKAEAVLTEIASGDSPEAKRAKEQLQKIDMMAKLAIGKPFPAFTGNDLDGKELTPAQYQGKVVLYDFWATWCGPCVREMPNVVTAYEAYHDKGFDVVGISLDRDGEADAVREFIKDNGMPWRQVYDGGGWKAAVAVQFGINSIPATFLVDRHGIIRYRDLRGKALEDAVAKLITEDI